MKIPGFSKDGYDLGIRLQKPFDLRVFRNFHVSSAGGAKGRDFCFLNPGSFDLMEKRHVLGVGTGPAAFYIMNAELVQTLGNQNLVVNRQTDALALSAVAECGVVD